MPATDCDVLIVGARVAGSSLAIRLAQQGRKVLAIDRDSFPSDTISTHFLAFNVVDMLRRLEVLDAILAAGFRRVVRHRAWIDDIAIDVPAGPRGAFSIAPKRYVLDQILIDRAREAGAQVIERARADGVIVEDGRVVGARVQMIGGEMLELRARVVVGADGKTSQFARWVDAPRYNERPPGRPVYLGYFHGVGALPQATIEMFFKDERFGFCFPMRPDEDLLCVEAQPAEFDEIRREPLAWLLATLRTLPGMDDRLRHAEIDGKVVGVRSVENCFRKPYGPGWALVGDAGVHQDPWTGEGMDNAGMCAVHAEDAIGDWLSGKCGEQEALDRYRKLRDERVLTRFEEFTGLAPDLSQLAGA